MENDFKKEAQRQYLHFFRIWFIIVGILLVVTVLVVVAKNMTYTSRERHNAQAPAERVYDYAEVLTDAEEEQLRELAEKCSIASGGRKGSAKVLQQADMLAIYRAAL